MTVDNQVKNCYYTIKQAEATFRQLKIKTEDKEAVHVFSTVEQIISLIKADLKKQLIFIAKEETEYE